MRRLGLRIATLCVVSSALCAAAGAAWAALLGRPFEHAIASVLAIGAAIFLLAAILPFLAGSALPSGDSGIVGQRLAPLVGRSAGEQQEYARRNVVLAAYFLPVALTLAAAFVALVALG